MGKDAPSEFIIATICAAIGLTFFPFPAPLFQRLSRRYQRRALIVLGLLAGGVVLAMNTPAWTNRVYDDMHPKRLGVHLQYNVGRIVTCASAESSIRALIPSFAPFSCFLAERARELTEI